MAARSVSFGGVASYLSASEPGALTLPAASRHRPATLAFGSSGLEYVTESHDAMPEVASAPANVMTTWWLYQPPTSGGRSAAELVTVGAVASYRSAKETAAVFPAASRHVPLTFALP